MQPADVPTGSGNPTRDLPLFTQDLISIAFHVEDSGWNVVDQTAPQVPYTFVDFTPLPATLTARLVDSKLELTWMGSGVLETRTSLTSGSWTEVPGAASGI